MAGKRQGGKRSGRPFDVVLFGPTGVTGREVARYLARRASELGITWAVAGRSAARIETVLDGLASRPDAVLTADVADPASVDAMVSQAVVVANLVGPYARYGDPVYAACARLGVHQLDLTGETDWVRRKIAELDSVALASGAKIVPTSGFEALPFDLGVLAAATAAFERFGEPIAVADVAVSISSTARLGGMSDAVSGGTFLSGVDSIRDGAGPGMKDPFALNPPGDRPRGARYELAPRRHRGTGAWLGPVFPSPFLNPPVIHRSAALARAAGSGVFAPGFRYREGTVAQSMAPMPAVVAPAIAAALAGGQVGFALAARSPAVVRRSVASFMERVGPSAGEGPRPETLDAWTYRLDVRVETRDGRTVDAVVQGEGHPGYKSTATMVGEAALILADPTAPVPAVAGFLTPATALGVDVIDRFEHAGLRVTVP
jgi:short subunit dehydrogenase-like uncharacterized protein